MPGTPSTATSSRATILSPADQREACQRVVETREAARVRGLTREERARRVRAHRAAVDLLVQANRGLVHVQANRAARRCRMLDVDDLVQAGSLGLVRAIEKFDPSRGVSFSTYACWWTGSFIARAIYDEDRAIRVPVHLRDLRKKLDRFTANFESREGRKPDVEELAHEAGLPRDRVADVMEIDVSHVLSLDAPLAPGASVTWGDLESSDAPSPEQEAGRLEREAKALALVACLPEREQAVIVGRFWGDLTLQEVGLAETRPVTRERIRQLERNALDRMRHAPA